MKSFFTRSLCVVLGLIGMAQLSAQEPFGSASLLPLPSADESQPAFPRTYPTRFGGSQEEISPSDQVQPFAPPPMSQDYQNAMKQSWDNAGNCGPATAA